jgi:hypothetical protein
MSIFLALLIAQDLGGLIQRLGDESPDARDEAGAGLEALGESAVDALIRALNSSDPEVQYRSELILQKLAFRLPPEALKRHPILARLKAREAAARIWSAIESLPAPIRPWNLQGIPQTQELIALGTEATPLLMAAAQDESRRPDLRLCAVTLLGEIREAGSIAVLARLLDSNVQILLPGK